MTQSFSGSTDRLGGYCLAEGSQNDAERIH